MNPFITHENTRQGKSSFVKSVLTDRVWPNLTLKEWDTYIILSVFLNDHTSLEEVNAASSILFDNLLNDSRLIRIFIFCHPRHVACSNKKSMRDPHHSHRLLHPVGHVVVSRKLVYMDLWLGQQYAAQRLEAVKNPSIFNPLYHTIIISISLAPARTIISNNRKQNSPDAYADDR